MLRDLEPSNWDTLHGHKIRDVVKAKWVAPTEYSPVKGQAQPAWKPTPVSTTNEPYHQDFQEDVRL
jgi:hypothetical protein